MAIDTGHVLEERYEILRALRSGGMGAVYLATDRRLASTRCAVKEILEHRLAGSDAAYLKERFKEEMAALATLDHPGIPRVRDYFQMGESFYIVMDYIDGQSLDYELAEAVQVTGRPLEPEVVAATCLQVLEILAYLHNHRPPIVHRDVKPSNLLRETRTGRVKLVDFGLAKAVDKSSQTMVGTPGYCAIEQMGGKAGPRSDLYSLGVTMHQLLSGETPRVLNLSPLREVMPDYRPDLAAIVERATEQKADDRYPNAEAMIADLRRWLQGESASNGAVRPLARIDQPGAGFSNGQAREDSMPARMLYSEVAPSTQALVTPQTPAWLWGAGMVSCLIIGLIASRMMAPLPETAAAPTPTPQTVSVPAKPTAVAPTVAVVAEKKPVRPPAPRAVSRTRRAEPVAYYKPPPPPLPRPRIVPAAPSYPVASKSRRARTSAPPSAPPTVAEQPAWASQQGQPPGGGGQSFQPTEFWQFQRDFGVRYRLPGGDLRPAPQQYGPMCMLSQDQQFWAQVKAFTYPGGLAQAMAEARRDPTSIQEATWFRGGRARSAQGTGNDLWIPMQTGDCYGGVVLKFKSGSGSTGLLCLVLKSHLNEQDALRRRSLLISAFGFD